MAGVPNDFKSDGCSLVPEAGVHDCCVEHDYHIRRRVLTPMKAHVAFLKCMWGKNKVVAIPYFIGAVALWYLYYQWVQVYEEQG